MSVDIDRYGQGGPLPRYIRRAARDLERYQLDNKVKAGKADSDTDAAMAVMEDDTMATGKAMEQVVRVARLQRQLEEMAPEASGRLALLADEHAFGMADDINRLRRRLSR